MRNQTLGVTFQSAHSILKSAADAVIESNQFSRIFDLLKISRTSYCNLKKSIVFNLSIQPAKVLAISLILMFPIISIFVCL